MKPRDYIGKQVIAAHARGGNIKGIVTACGYMPGYGWRLTIDGGMTVALGDVMDVKDSELEVMARHYVIACLWADCPEGTHPRATASAMAHARKTCAEFIAAIGPARMQAIRDAYANGYGAHPDCGPWHPWMAALGHDFYLSRQGHGVGFQDRAALPEELREYLQSLCYYRGQFKEVYPEFYRGWLYIR